MQQKTLLWATAFCAVIFLTGAADAARVGIVITQPQGVTFIKCLSVDKSLNAYEVLKYTGQDITWSPPGELWGHGLCAIEGTGCPVSNCFFCDGENAWRFYVKQWSSDSWIPYMKSFDGGNNCDDHYCAQDGDVMGFAYGPDGTQPAALKYADVCKPITSSGSKDTHDEADEETTTSRKETTTTIAPASITTQQTTTTQEETTTIAITTTTQRPATTTTEATTTTTRAPTTTTPTTTIKAPTTTLSEEQPPGIIGNVIAYSVNNSPVIAAIAVLFAAAYINYGFYKKKARNKNA
jgi:hypothetical protein